jgi:hypothetical protein
VLYTYPASTDRPGKVRPAIPTADREEVGGAVADGHWVSALILVMRFSSSPLVPPATGEAVPLKSSHALCKDRRRRLGLPPYLSFSAMLRCSLRCGRVLPAQVFSSESSPLFE